MSKRFVSLFTGAGGMDQGFIDAGWEPALMVDNWKPAIDTLVANHCGVEIAESDLSKIDPSLLTSRVGDIVCIIGGPPCQAFSRLNQNKLFSGGCENEDNLNDPRRSLFMDFLRVVRYLKPPFVVMENVADLKVRRLGGNGASRNRQVIDVIFEEFGSAGYNVVAGVLKASDFNVPQMRRRIVFIGVRKDLGIVPSMPCPVPLSVSVMSEFAKIKNKHPNQHRKTKSQAWIDLVSHIPQGGYYNDLPLEHKVLLPVDKTMLSGVDLFKRTARISDGYCLRTVNGTLLEGEVSAVVLASGVQFYKVMPRMGTYLRRIKETVSHTVTRNPLIHPTENREITVREKAAIQTFPPEYCFSGTIQDQHILVGNAVPCNLGRAIAEHIGSLYG